MTKTRLYSYKMTHDNGFAPNPFHGILTLANCKPRMRINNQIGDWIAGFTSKTLTNDDKDVYNPKLIYLMQVTNKIKYPEYWEGPEFKDKIPNLNTNKVIDKTGDNIYKPIRVDGRIVDFEQLENSNHKKEAKAHDLSGEYVLISKRFYYFGGDPIPLIKYSPHVPQRSSSYGYLTEGEDADRFIKFIESKFKHGVNNYPHKWKDEIKGCK